MNEKIENLKHFLRMIETYEFDYNKVNDLATTPCLLHFTLEKYFDEKLDKTDKTLLKLYLRLIDLYWVAKFLKGINLTKAYSMYKAITQKVVELSKKALEVMER